MSGRKTTRGHAYGDPGFLEVEIEDLAFLEWVDKKAAKQARFATAVALTWTAKDGVSDLQRRLRGPFTIRNRFTERSIRMQPATKRELVATVGSIQPYMRLQAMGGDRRGTNDSGTRVGVPFGARPTRQAKTTLSKMPMRIIGRGGWLGPLRKAGTPGVWKIKGGKKRKRQKLVLMYSMHSKVRVQKAWDFLRQLERAIARTWEKNATAALERAIKTRRK